MSDKWLDRLHETLQDNPKSLRAISKAAGCGPNYLQQMLRNGKEPGADRLARILDVLGREKSLYVLTGIDISKEDRELFEIVTRSSGNGNNPSEKNYSEAKIAFIKQAHRAIYRMADEVSDEVLERILSAGSDISTMARAIGDPSLTGSDVELDTSQNI